MTKHDIGLLLCVAMGIFVTVYSGQPSAGDVWFVGAILCAMIKP